MVVLVGFLRVGLGGVELRTLAYMNVQQVQPPQKLVKTQTQWASGMECSTPGSGATAAKDPRRSSKRRNYDLDSGLWRHSSQGPQEEQQEAEMHSTPGSGAKSPRLPGGVAKGGTGPSTLGSGEHAKIPGGASGAATNVQTPMKSRPRQTHRF